MKTLLMTLLFLSTGSVFADSIRCKELNGGLREVILMKKSDIKNQNIKSELSAKQIKILGEDQDQYSNYDFHFFVGEATPMMTKAVGAESDVQLSVVSADARLQLYTYLDELGENDISSTLIVNGEEVQMNCQ